MRHASIPLAFALAVAACAAPEPDELPQGAIRQRLATERAVVESVDAERREVVLREEDGETYAVLLSEEAPSMEGLQPGDVVVTERYSSLAVARAGAQAPRRPEQTSEMASAPGEAGRPGATAGATTDETAVLVSYDSGTATALIDVVGGQRRPVSVSPELERFFEGLAPGDWIELTRTELVSIQVLPPSAAAEP